MVKTPESAPPAGAVRAIHFGSCRLDLAGQRLWKENAPVHLRTKSWQVLRHLAERPGVLVSSEELLREIWPDAFVVPKVVTNVIRELRDALGETPHTQGTIETVHRRGYRFVAPVRFEVGAHQAADWPRARDDAVGGDETDPFAGCFAGREGELKRLRGLWKRAADGALQMCFITGEVGIGKTALLTQFAAHLASSEARPPAVSWGHCLQQHGPGEPYLPILQALEQLASGPAGVRLTELLRRYAPTWVAQVPWLLQVDARGTPLISGGPSVMLREGAAALDAISREIPVALILEDLHWSDPASVDFLRFLPQRCNRARLLVLGAYRGAEAAAHAHPIVPLVHEMQQRGAGEHIALSALSPAALRTYVDQCFGSAALSDLLTPIVEDRSARSPLYARLVIQHFIDRGWLRHGDGGWSLTVNPAVLTSEPVADVNALIAAQSEYLSPSESRLLTAASVQGVEFSIGALASTTEEPRELVERVCSGLSTRAQFVRRSSRPVEVNATEAKRYEFLHVLYQRAFYERLPTAVAKHFHRRVAEHAERSGAEQVAQSAGSIAFHFKAAGEGDRAAQYLELAALADLRRCAYREAAAHLTDAIAELAHLPATPERAEREARCSLLLASAQMLFKGYGHLEPLQAAERALALYTALGHSFDVLHALAAVVNGWAARGEFDRAAVAQARLAEIAEDGPVSLRGVAHAYLGVALSNAGRLVEARRHLEEALTLQPRADVLLLLNEATLALAYLAWVLAQLGDLDQARRCLERALAASDEDSAMGRAHVLRVGVMMAATTREGARASAFTDTLAEMDAEYDLPGFLPSVRIIRCWARAMQRPTRRCIGEIRAALAERHELGERAEAPMYLALLAEVCLRCGEPEEAAAAISEALAQLHASGSHLYEAELLRLRGEVALAGRGVRGQPSRRGRRRRADDAQSAEGERSFRRAVAAAAEQGTRLWGLRAAVSLARLLAEHGRAAEAREVLSTARAEITGGGASPDVRAAAVLLAELVRLPDHPRARAARRSRRRKHVDQPS